MAKMMMPRLMRKEQAKIVANAGGLIGIWRHLTDSPLAYAQNIKAMVEVVGVDHVCLGTDTKLTPAYRSPNANQNRPNNDNQPKRFGERTNEIWESQHSGYFYAVVEELLKLGLKEPEIIKIGGANFCKVFDEVKETLNRPSRRNSDAELVKDTPEKVAQGQVAPSTTDGKGSVREIVFYT